MFEQSTQRAWIGIVPPVSCLGCCSVPYVCTIAHCRSTVWLREMDSIIIIITQSVLDSGGDESPWGGKAEGERGNIGWFHGINLCANQWLQVIKQNIYA